MRQLCQLTITEALFHPTSITVQVPSSSSSRQSSHLIPLIPLTGASHDALHPKGRTRAILDRHINPIPLESYRRLPPLRCRHPSKLDQSLPLMEDQDQTVPVEVFVGCASLEKDRILVRGDSLLSRVRSTCECRFEVYSDSTKLRLTRNSTGLE